MIVLFFDNCHIYSPLYLRIMRSFPLIVCKFCCVYLRSFHCLCAFFIIYALLADNAQLSLNNSQMSLFICWHYHQKFIVSHWIMRYYSSTDNALQQIDNVLSIRSVVCLVVSCSHYILNVYARQIIDIEQITNQKVDKRAKKNERKKKLHDNNDSQL